MLFFVKDEKPDDRKQERIGKLADEIKITFADPKLMENNIENPKCEEGDSCLIDFSFRIFFHKKMILWDYK